MFHARIILPDAEETVFSNRSLLHKNSNEMKKKTAKVSSKKMSVKEITEKNEPSNEALSRKDNQSEVIEIFEEDQNKAKEGKPNETDEDEVFVERKKMKKNKKSLSSASSEDDEINDDIPDEESKKQVKHSKKESLKKRNKKTKRGRRKKERDDDKDDGSDGNYEVERIIEVKLLRNGKREFLIQWKGFSSEYNSWEPEANLDCEDLIKKYFEQNKVNIESGEEEAEESENSSSRKRSKYSENPKKSNGRKRRFSEGKGKDTEERSNRNKLPKKEGSDTEDSEKRTRVTRSLQGKKAKLQTGEYKGKRKDGSDVSVPGRSFGGKSRKFEEDQNKENFTENEDDSEGRNESEESCDSGVDDVEYEVEKIVDVRPLENGSREFLIKWKGFSPKDNTWEPEKHLNCNAKVKKFLQGFKQNSSARELRFKRKKTERFTLESQRCKRKLSSRLEKMPPKSYKEDD